MSCLDGVNTFPKIHQLKLNTQKKLQVIYIHLSFCFWKTYWKLWQLYLYHTPTRAKWEQHTPQQTMAEVPSGVRRVHTGWQQAWDRLEAEMASESGDAGLSRVESRNMHRIRAGSLTQHWPSCGFQSWYLVGESSEHLSHGPSQRLLESVTSSLPGSSTSLFPHLPGSWSFDFNSQLSTAKLFLLLKSLAPSVMQAKLPWLQSWSELSQLAWNPFILSSPRNRSAMRFPDQGRNGIETDWKKKKNCYRFMH